MSDTNEVLDAAETGKSCCAPPEATCVNVDGKCVPLEAFKRRKKKNRKPPAQAGLRGMFGDDVPRGRHRWERLPRRHFEPR